MVVSGSQWLKWWLAVCGCACIRLDVPRGYVYLCVWSVCGGGV